MKQYLDLLQKIMDDGVDKGDRTGVGTRSVFGAQARFDLSQGFPLLTTKKMFLKGIIHELIWFVRGDTNIKYLVDNGVRIWNEWPYQKPWPTRLLHWRVNLSEPINNNKDRGNNYIHSQ